MTVEEVGKFFRISQSSVYRMIENRLIPFYKIQSGLRFSEDDLIEYLEKCKFESIDKMVK